MMMLRIATTENHWKNVKQGNTWKNSMINAVVFHIDLETTTNQIRSIKLTFSEQNLMSTLRFFARSKTVVSETSKLIILRV